MVCHPAPPSQRVQFVDTTMMMPMATMNMRIRHANSNTLFQSIPGLVMDQSHSSASLPLIDHRPGSEQLTNPFLITRSGRKTMVIVAPFSPSAPALALDLARGPDREIKISRFV
jgi:hypothetical protein